MKRGRRLRESAALVDKDKFYELGDAVDILKSIPPAKFDETIELSCKLGVDSKHADQMVRGSTILPHGSGKVTRVLVFAKGEKAHEASDAGADFVGDKDLIDKVAKGWLDFDTVVATPDMMRDIARLGKVLGTRGLMPSPKAGTVTVNIKNIVTELKSGRVDFKVDKANDIHVPVGKVSFTSQNIKENALAVLDAILKAKPSVAKGKYLRKASLAATMGHGINLNVERLGE